MQKAEAGRFRPSLRRLVLFSCQEEMQEIPEYRLPGDFVVDELELYLDTHAEDQEAFELYQTMLAVKKEAMERYAQRCAPLLQTDQLGMERYAWLDSPWPWEYRNKREG